MRRRAILRAGRGFILPVWGFCDGALDDRRAAENFRFGLEHVLLLPFIILPFDARVA
jgi:hypothetical protein